MKNVYLLPTNPNDETKKGIWIKETRDWSNIYIISEEEIKEGAWIIDLDSKRIVKANSLRVATSKASKCWYYKKVILTTDQDLIKDGVQAIDDKFLEWFVKNPSCEEVEIGEGVRYEDEWIDNEDGGEIFQHQYCCYKIIIPKEEPTMIDDWLNEYGDPEIYKKVERKLELMEAAEKLAMDKLKSKWEHLYIFGYPQKPFPTNYENDLNNVKVGLYEGAKWQMDKQSDFIIGFLEFIEGTYSYSNIYDHWYLNADTSKTYSKKQLLKVYLKSK